MEQAKICQLFKKFGKCPLGKNCKLAHPVSPQPETALQPKPESDLDPQIERVKKRYKGNFEPLIQNSTCIGFRIKVKPNFDIFKFNIIGDPENFLMALNIYIQIEKKAIKEKSPVFIIPQNIPQHLSEAVTCAALKLVQFQLYDLLKFIENHCETILDFVVSQIQTIRYGFAPWSQTEQLKLDFALQIFPNQDDDSRWTEIAQIVWSRNPKECEQRIIDLQQEEKKKQEPEPLAPSEEKSTSESKTESNEIEEKEQETKQKVPLTKQEQEEQNKVTNVLKHSWNKHLVHISDLTTTNVGYMKLQALRLDVKCQNCGKGLEMTLTHHPKIAGSQEVKLMVCSTECSSCNQKIIAIFSPKVLHQHNLYNTGYLVIEQAKPFDILPSNFEVMCEACMEDPPLIFKKCKHHTHISDHCRHCHAEIKFKFLSLRLRGNDEYDQYFRYLTSWKKQLLETVKPKTKGLSKGKPLPMNGTCKHYKRSFRWFRFSCCGKLFPCDECHNSHEEHKNEMAKLMVCGFCSDQQPFEIRNCRSCKRDLTGQVQLKSKHWEGGKGQRDKQKMSTKDNHKYKGMNKTISNRSKKL